MGLNKRLIDQAGAAGFEPTDNFAPVLYTGNGSTQSITSLDFQPDLVWIKNRSAANGHLIYDSIRGAGFWIASQLTTAEDGASGDLLASFDSNGFTVNTDYLGGTNPSSNNNGDNFVAWCWKAGGAAVSNTDGSITSTVSANQDAGFSIVKYTGTDTGDETVGHGLLQKPELVLYKNLDGAYNWSVYSAYLTTPEYYYLKLNTTDAEIYDLSMWNATDLTSSVLQLGSRDNVNSLNQEHIAYCFHSVDGYQKIGSYIPSSGTATINLGFQPRFILFKNTSNSVDWFIHDSLRGEDNGLYPNTSNAEGTGYNNYIDITSTGFVVKNNLNKLSTSGNTYIYLAIA